MLAIKRWHFTLESSNMDSINDNLLAIMMARYNEVMDLPDQSGVPRLISAAKNGEKGVLMLMLKLGARTDVTDNNGNNVLHVASKETVQQIPFFFELRTKPNKNGIVPFEKALFAQDFELAEQLSTPDLRPQYRRWASQAIKENKIKVLEILLTYRVEVDKPLNGSYLIFEAVQRRSLEMVNLLLVYGAHPNITISGQITPLVQAVYLNDDEIVKTLVEHGANPGWVTGNFTTPLLIAIEGGFDKAYHGMIEDCSKETIDWISPQTGQTALTTALNLKRYDLAEDLLNWNADEIRIDDQERTLVHRMVLANDVQAVRLLLECTYSVCNRHDANGNTPLIDAIMGGTQEMIKLLVQHRRVVLTLTNLSGNTPLSIADDYTHNLIGAEMVADKAIEAVWRINVPGTSVDIEKVIDLVHEDIRARISRQDKKINIERWLGKADRFSPTRLWLSMSWIISKL